MIWLLVAPLLLLLLLTLPWFMILLLLLLLTLPWFIILLLLLPRLLLLTLLGWMRELTGGQ